MIVWLPVTIPVWKCLYMELPRCHWTNQIKITEFDIKIVTISLDINNLENLHKPYPRKKGQIPIFDMVTL